MRFLAEAITQVRATHVSMGFDYAGTAKRVEEWPVKLGQARDGLFDLTQTPETGS